MISRLQIGNWQLEIADGSDGRPAPAHTKLGAKWVEVGKRRAPAESDSKMKAKFETASNNRGGVA